ncbi:glycosyltransferase [uncultured Desulfobacter sp.]|uniref:glycosyltransferase n=1 Tax=uncultured Desulfobacter sp. TaxID=240139 RepID=UPI0029F59B58|nr:glycosyltransferase [uncultured Desulfobacter sp.]
MCRAFNSIGVDVILVLNNPDNIKKKNVYKILETQYGKPIEFDLVLNSSSIIKHKKLGKYFNTSYYKKLIKQISPDLCFVRSPLMMKACIQANTKYIYELHNNIMHQGSRLLSKYWCQILINEASNNRLIKIITISRNLKKFWVTKGIDESRIIALHDGVHTEMFRSETSQEEARRKLGLPSKGKIILYSGSLYDNREMGNILILADKIQEANFVVVGGPENNAKELSQQAINKGLNNIIFSGRQPHIKIPQYLFAADVLLALWSKKVPTINYCSPLKLFEYMAAGRIIVAHGFPTITEVLMDNVNAFIAAPENFQNLLMRVKEALNTTYPNEIGKKARQLALKEYSWETRAEKILKACWLDD